MPVNTAPETKDNTKVSTGKMVNNSDAKNRTTYPKPKEAIKMPKHPNLPIDLKALSSLEVFIFSSFDCMRLFNST